MALSRRCGKRIARARTDTVLLLTNTDNARVFAGLILRGIAAGKEKIVKKKSVWKLCFKIRRATQESGLSQHLGKSAGDLRIMVQRRVKSDRECADYAGV